MACALRRYGVTDSGTSQKSVFQTKQCDASRIEFHLSTASSPVLDNLGVQPILSFGSGMSRRYPKPETSVIQRPIKLQPILIKYATLPLSIKLQRRIRC
jgi:hypothetical protein